MKNLKKVFLLVVAFVLSVFALTSCNTNGGQKTSGAQEAAKKVVVQQDKQQVSNDFLVAAIVKVNGVEKPMQTATTYRLPASSPMP